ncbi:MAG: ABC transporter permease [Planctomycetota bacterium]
MIKWILAWRYFMKRPITLLAVVAVTLCVFIVVVVMTVMNGLLGDFEEKNHAFAGDCVIASDSLVGFGYYEEFLETLDGLPEVAAASPVAKGVGVAVVPLLNKERNVGIEIYGIDPVRHSKATNFAQTLHYTNPEDIADAFSPSYAPGLPGCIPGVDVLGGRATSDGGRYHPETPLTLEFAITSFPLNTKGGFKRAGAGMVITKSFFYCDDSRSGIVRSVDSVVVYLPLEQAQILCGMDSPLKRISSIHIKFAKGVSHKAAIAKISDLWGKHVAAYSGKPAANLLDNVRVQSWRVNRRRIISPMEKEQIMMTMSFLLLGVITVFIIFVVLYMIISHKSKDIGILKSIGLSVHEILSVFLIFSVFIGLVGALIGSVGGCIFLIKINEIEDFLYAKIGFQMWDPQFFAIHEIPNQIEPTFIITVIAAAITACLIGGLIPSLQAARRKPTEILQVNQL